MKRENRKVNVTFERKEEMTFIGYYTVIRPEEGYRKCPNLGTKSLLQNMQNYGRQ